MLFIRKASAHAVHGVTRLKCNKHTDFKIYSYIKIADLLFIVNKILYVLISPKVTDEQRNIVVRPLLLFNMKTLNMKHEAIK